MERKDLIRFFYKKYSDNCFTTAGYKLFLNHLEDPAYLDFLWDIAVLSYYKDVSEVAYYVLNFNLDKFTEMKNKMEKVVSRFRSKPYYNEISNDFESALKNAYIRQNVTPNVLLNTTRKKDTSIQDKMKGGR